MPPNDRRTPHYDMEVLIGRLEKSISHIEAGFSYSNVEIQSIKAELHAAVRRLDEINKDSVKNEDKLENLVVAVSSMNLKTNVLEKDIEDLSKRLQPFDQGNGHSLKTLLYDAGTRLTNLENTKKWMIGFATTLFIGVALALVNSFWLQKPNQIDPVKLKQEMREEFESTLENTLSRKQLKGNTADTEGVSPDGRTINRR